MPRVSGALASLGPEDERRAVELDRAVNISARDMAKSAGLPVDIGGDRADHVLWAILYSLDHEFPDRGALAQKFVLPVVGQHGFIEPEGGRQDISDSMNPWFKGLDEPTKIRVLRAIVQHLVSRSDEFTKRVVLRSLKRRNLAFLQGSFFDTTIKGSEYRTVFHVYQPEKKPVGEGGNGTVYKVRRDDNQPFAMKLLTKVDLQSSRRNRFSNELWFCAQSDHPNIVKVSDWGLSAHGGEPFYVMQLLDCSLRKLIDDGIDPDDVPKLFATALAGVEAAHKKGIYHRDLKPENLLCDRRSGELVVADFGIAHFTPDTMRAHVDTQRGAWVANRNYAAPEQRQKNGEVDHRADIYALGLILNEMFTGELALAPDQKLIADAAPRYAHLDNLVRMMLSKTPADRPAIAKILKALDREAAPRLSSDTGKTAGRKTGRASKTAEQTKFPDPPLKSASSGKSKRPPKG